MGNIVSEPFYLPVAYHEGSLTAKGRARLETLRVLSTAVGIVSFIKAYFLREHAPTALPYFPEDMSAASKRSLRSLYFLAWYAAIRLVVTSFGNRNILKTLAARLEGASDLRVVAMCWWLACLAEEVATLLVSTANDSREELVGTPVDSSRFGTRASNPASAARRCCICQDSSRRDIVYSFCTHSRRHVAHWRCMEAWQTSGQRMARYCPVCRSPLRTKMPSFKQRIVQALASTSASKCRNARLQLNTMTIWPLYLALTARRFVSLM